MFQISKVWVVMEQTVIVVVHVHVICAWNRKKILQKQVPKSAWVDSNKIHFINNIVQDRRYIIIMFIQYLSRQSQY